MKCKGSCKGSYSVGYSCENEALSGFARCGKCMLVCDQAGKDGSACKLPAYYEADEYPLSDIEANWNAYCKEHIGLRPHKERFELLVLIAKLGYIYPELSQDGHQIELERSS